MWPRENFDQPAPTVVDKLALAAIFAPQVAYAIVLACQWAGIWA